MNMNRSLLDIASNPDTTGYALARIWNTTRITVDNYNVLHAIVTHRNASSTLLHNAATSWCVYKQPGDNYTVLDIPRVTLSVSALTNRSLVGNSW
jgi:hypothetical protein